MLAGPKSAASKDQPEIVDHFLWLGSMCVQLHCLPRAGGLLDQDPLDIAMLTEYITSANERDAKEQARANNRK